MATSYHETFQTANCRLSCFVLCSGYRELPYRALTWPLTWFEGSARPLRAHVLPALLLVTDMPHWDLGPLLYDMGHLREGRVLGRPPANCRLRSRLAEELTLVTFIHWPARPGPWSAAALGTCVVCEASLSSPPSAPGPPWSH